MVRRKCFQLHALQLHCSGNMKTFGGEYNLRDQPEEFQIWRFCIIKPNEAHVSCQKKSAVSFHLNITAWQQKVPRDTICASPPTEREIVTQTICLEFASSLTFPLSSISIKGKLFPDHWADSKLGLPWREGKCSDKYHISDVGLMLLCARHGP